MLRQALVVGINNYPYLGNLKTPAGDAEQIASLLRKHGSFQVVKRLPMKDNEGLLSVDEKPSPQQLVTLEELKKAIGELFNPQGNDVPDTALLYFAGHGLRETWGGGIIKGFLAASDANPQKNIWGLSFNDLQQLLQLSSVKEQIIWLDCCYSGVLLNGQFLNFNEAYPGNRGEARDRFFIAACGDASVAYENAEHGILTSLLLKGLDPQTCEIGKWIYSSDLKVSIKKQQENDDKLKTYPQRLIFFDVGGDIQLIQGEKESKVVVSNQSQNICPYKGLAAFDFNDEDPKYFYGRTALTDELLEKLRLGNFLAVIGASGCGKSSVVKAGLLYQLKLGQRLSGSNEWKILPVIRPGGNPLYSLAEAFTGKDSKKTYIKYLEDQLKNNGAETLKIFIDEDLEKYSRVVLVVDQFEEVFTLCEDKKQRKKIVDHLLDAVESSNNKLCLVITIRADFVGECTAYPELAKQIEQDLVTVTPMTTEELTEAIKKPASKVGLEVQETLVTQMIADVQESPESLPLLQFTLMELWEKRNINTTRNAESNSQQLTLSVYQQMDGVKGALNRHAQQIYDYTDYESPSPLQKRQPEQQKLIRRFFLKFVRTGEGVKDTRQPQPKNELMAIAGEDLQQKEELSQLIEELIQERLLIASEEEIIDLAHEALMSGWEEFVKWRRENRDLLRLRDRLNEALQQWLYKKQDKEYLMHRGLLAEVRGRWEKLELYLDNTAKEFYQLSDDNEKDLIAKQEDRITELENTRTRLENALTESQLREKAARVQNLIPTQPLDALLLAVEAVKTNLDWISNKDQISQKESIPIKVLAEKPGSILGVVQASLSEAVARAIAPNVCEGHQEAVISVAFSSEGEMIVSGSRNMVYFWDSSGKKMRSKPLRLCTDKSYWVTSIAFSSKLKKILSGCFDGTILVWNFDGKLLHTLQGHTDTVNAVAFSSNGEMIVSASSDKTLRLWNTKTGESIGQPLDGHEDSVNAVAFSPDGKTIASGGKDKTILLWNISDQSIKPIPLRGHDDCVYSVAFSPDRQMIVSGSQDTTVRLWTIKGSPIGQPLRGHDDCVYSVTFSPDGKTIASGSKDTTVRLWTIEGSPIGQPLRKHEDAVYSVAFSPDGQMIISGSSDKTIIFWAIINHNPIFKPLCKHENTVNAVVFSPNEEMIVSASSDKTLRLWNTKTGESIGQPLGGHTNSVNAVAFSPDGEMIVSASSDKTLRLWNTKTGESIREPLGGHEDVVSAVAFSPDGEMIVSGSFDSRICLWNIQGQCISQVSHNTGSQISSVAFSPNGEMIVSGTFDGRLCLWKINNNRITEKPLRSMILREKDKAVDIKVSCVAFSPNGEMIVSGNSDGKLRLWNLKGDDIEDTEPWVAHPNNNGVTCIAFSPDGQMIASGGSDRVIQLWDIKGNRIGETSRQHEDIITSIAFSPDGKLMATSSVDKKIYLWRGGWREWLEICCKRLVPIILKQPCKDMNESCEICVTYKFWSRTDFAAILKEHGDFLANPQQKKEAEEKFRKAEEYDSDFKFEPKKLKKLIAHRQIQSLPFDGRKGQIKEVIKDLGGIDPTLDLLTPSECDELCWFGSLYQCQDDPIVMAACEKAVESEPENSSFRATRGVAKVLRSMKTLEDKKPNSEIEEAIEDFNAYIADKKIHDEDQKLRCRKWIVALRAGENPFTDEEIKKLLGT